MDGESAITSSDEIEITLEMISAGVEAYRKFDPEMEEPEALVFAIIYRALKSAKEYAAIKRSVCF